MADRAARPGKHKARHRRPSKVQRVRDRVPDLRGPAIVSAAGGVLAAAAVAGTWVVVTDDGGVDVAAADDRPTTSTSSSTSMEYQRAAPEVSRDVDRPSLSSLKAEAMGEYSYGGDHAAGRVTVQREELATADSDPQDIAMAMLPQYGWDSSQFGCLDDLWYGESGWDPYAENPYSGAYGIPQALPGSKMAAAGADWETNPATQIEWGLGYIQDRYGSPCSANDFKLANGWY